MTKRQLLKRGLGLVDRKDLCPNSVFCLTSFGRLVLAEDEEEGTS